MDEILSLAEEGNDEFAGYLRTADHYHRFYFTKAGLEIADTWDINEFKNYDHFAGRIGAHDPESIFLVDPVKVKELTLESLKNAFAAIKKVLAEGLEEDGEEDEDTDLVDPELSRKMAVVVNTPLFAWQSFEFQDAFRERAMKVEKMSDFSKEDREFIKKALESIGQNVWERPQA